MDPSATALMHDIGVILDDFKSDMVEWERVNVDSDSDGDSFSHSN